MTMILFQAQTPVADRWGGGGSWVDLLHTQGVFSFIDMGFGVSVFLELEGLLY